MEKRDSTGSVGRGAQLLLLAAAHLACQAPTVSSENHRLQAGDRHDNTLSQGADYEYVLAASEHDFLHLVVEQNGIDLVLELFEPGAKQALHRVDSKNAWVGIESLTTTLERGGDYRARIHATTVRTNGTYSIHLVALRAPSEVELERARAWDRVTGFRELPAPARRDRRSWLEEAVAGFERAGESFGLGEAHYSLGMLRRDGPEQAEALHNFRAAADAFRLAGRGFREAESLNEAGRIAERAGDVDAALELYKRSLGLFERFDFLRRQKEVHTNLGLLYEKLGMEHEANRHLTRSEQLSSADEDDRGRARALANLARQYLDMGQELLAKLTAEQALAMQEEIGDTVGQAITLNVLGLHARRFGEPEEAIAYYERMIETVEGEDRYWTATARTGLASSYAQIGAMERARSLHREALATYRELGRRRDQAIMLLSIGRTYDDGDEPSEEAETYYQKALSLVEGTEDRDLEASILFRIARHCRRRADVSCAVDAARHSVAVVETLRRSAFNPNFRAGYFSTKQDYYVEWAAALLDKHSQTGDPRFIADAVEVAERRRARNLLSFLEADVDWRHPTDGGGEPRELEVYRELEKLDAAYLAWLDATDPSERRELEATYRDTLRSYETVRTRLESTPSQTGTLLVAEEMRALLGPDDSLLVFQLGEDESHAWIVTNESIEAVSLAARSLVEDAANRYWELLTTGRDDPTLIEQRDLSARYLSDLVVAPIAPTLVKPRIAIVADGPLERVPFAALPLPGPGEDAGDPLVTRFETLFVPSASVLAALRARGTEPDPRASALAYVDPVYRPDDPRLEGRAAASQGGHDLRRLFASAHEAEALQALVEPGRLETRAGFDARRKHLLAADLSRHVLIHFGVHGLLNDGHSELSALALSSITSDGVPVDGKLRAFEIANLDLRAELVVLAACDSALGREQRGEGLVGLTQAFFQAGAERVVASLWPVDDGATSELLQRFYRALLVDRLPPAAALRKSQLSMLQDPQGSDIEDWAAFALFGDWTPTEQITAIGVQLDRTGPIGPE